MRERRQGEGENGREREGERRAHTHREWRPGSEVPPRLFLALPRKRSAVPFPSLPASLWEGRVRSS